MVRAFFVLKMKEMFRISEQEKEIVMRRSNWKSKLVVVIAVVIGILCGLAAAYDTIYEVHYTRFLPDNLILRSFKEENPMQYLVKSEREQLNRSHAGFRRRPRRPVVQTPPSLEVRPIDGEVSGESGRSIRPAPLLMHALSRCHTERYH